MKAFFDHGIEAVVIFAGSVIMQIGPVATVFLLGPLPLYLYWFCRYALKRRIEAKSWRYATLGGAIVLSLLWTAIILLSAVALQGVWRY